MTTCGGPSPRRRRRYRYDLCHLQCGQRVATLASAQAGFRLRDAFALGSTSVAAPSFKGVTQRGSGPGHQALGLLPRLVRRAGKAIRPVRRAWRFQVAGRAEVGGGSVRRESDPYHYISTQMWRGAAQRRTTYVFRRGGNASDRAGLPCGKRCVGYASTNRVG